MSDQLQVRLATADDLPAINDIYNYYVTNSTSTYQTTPCDTAERMRWFVHHDPEHPVTVCIIDGMVVGWSSISRFHVREAYRHTVESSVYVHHDYLHRGIGRALMQDLIVRARMIGHHTMLAGISADQEPSVRLHDSLGFTQACHLREVGRKFDRWLDVVWMQLML